MESFEVVGEWWLPEHSDRKLAGRLVVDPVDGSHLTLIGGSLREVTDVATWTHNNGESQAQVSEDDFEVAGSYPRILGEAEGQRYTLEDGVQVNYRGAVFGRGYWQQVNVRSVLRGVHVPDGQAPSATTIILRPAGLNIWVPRSGISGAVAVDSREIKVRATPLSADSAPLADGGSVELRHHLGRPEFVEDGLHIAEWFTLAVVRPTPAPLEDLIDSASDLHDLITIATGRPAVFDKLSLRHPDVVRDMSALPGVKEAVSDGQLLSPIDLWARWAITANPRAKPLRAADLYFNLEQFGGLPGLARWLDTVRKHRSSLGRVMSTRTGNHGQLHDFYLDRVAAVEGMDTREHGDQIHFRERLLRSARVAGRPMDELLSGHLDAWSRQLTKDRNDMAHHKAVRLTEQLSEQHFLSESVYWLYVLRMLRMAQAPEAVFGQITDNRNFEFLKCQLAKFLP
ncbi:hypothetical protein AB0M02_10605 [Actinoplanes sp. NPDC051861]|uniref:ApeA N-terminal domain 1-containing protein n=1 Tax=Actinoplanes sp. NPDC051861 TaxID=3155170 RepID=UPI0034133391